MKLEWKVHTPNLLKEVLENASCQILEKPLMILGEQLHEVAQRAAEIDDPRLNQMMARLTLYEMADPELDGHDKETLEYVLSDKYLQDNEDSQNENN